MLSAASGAMLSMATPPAQPSLAAVASSMISQVNQWVVTLEQDVSSIGQNITEDIAQAEARLVQRVDQIFGIPTAGSGSGSGAATTANNTPNRQLNIGAHKVGSGSGSGAAGTAQDKNPKHGGSKIEPMTDEGDGYTWDPQSSGSGSGHAPSNILASDFHNWLKNGQVQLANGTIPGNQPTDRVLFDGSTSNSPIEWNQSFTFSTETIGGFGAYTGLQTLDSGDNVDLTGVDGASGGDGAGSDLNIHFDDHNQHYEIDKNFTINNMDVTGYSDDAILITGGTTTIADAPGLKENLGVSLMVEGGGTLIHWGFVPLTLTNNNLTITVSGTASFYYGANQGITLIDTGAHQFNYIDVHGKLNYAGAGGVVDTFTVPVFVESGGTFALYSYQGEANGAKLIVKDQSNYTFPNGSKESVYMTSAATDLTGVLLSQAATLEADDGYYQAGGDLESTDATACTLQVGAASGGTATIAGGQLVIQATVAPPPYVQFNLKAQTLNFAGQLYVGIDASKPNQQNNCNLLHVTGTTNLQAGATLKVGVANGPPQNNNNNNKWTIIQDDGGNITGNFAMPITTVPQTNNLTPTVNNKLYLLTS